MTKRVVVERYGGPEVLKVVEEDDPRPDVGDARVKVLVAGVSFTDARLRADHGVAERSAERSNADVPVHSGLVSIRPCNPNSRAPPRRPSCPRAGV